jgi:copper(I)-binding protein
LTSDETDPTRRDQALAALRDALTEVLDTGDPAAALADELTALEADLVAANPDLETDLLALHALGILHWLRYVALPIGVDEHEFELAVRLLFPVFVADRDAVPEPLRQFFATRISEDPTTRAIELFTRYESTDDISTLHQAISLLRHAVTDAASGHPHRSVYLSNLCLALLKLFERAGDPAVLDESVDIGREAVIASPLDDPHRGQHLSILGASLRTLARRNGATEVLEDAVRVGREALTVTPADHPDRAKRLSDLGVALHALFEQDGNPVTLEESVRVGREAIATAAHDHPDRATYLADLGGALRALFERTRDIARLDESVRVGREAVAITPLDHPHRASYLSDLGLALRVLFERVGDTAALDESVRVGREAVAITPPDDTHLRAGYLSNLGIALYTLFEWTGDTAILEESVRVGREVIAMTPLDHHYRAMYLSNVGLALRSLFERSGDTAVLDEAVRVGREAVAITPPDHTHRRALCLSNLGIALRLLFERSGDVAVLDEAVRVGREAVATTPPDHPNRAMYLSNVGMALLFLFLFRRNGDTAALEAAVLVEREAVAVAPRDRPNRAMYLSHLGLALHTLFARTGDTAALEEAVRVGREAVTSAPPGHPNRAMFLSNLASAMYALFGRTANTSMLKDAVQVGREAVAASPADHPNRVKGLSNLGLALGALSARTGDTAALDEAVRVGREAVAATPPDHPDSAMYLSNLGLALRALFAVTTDISVLEDAVRVGRAAITAAPPDHPDRARYLCSVGIALHTLFEQNGSTAALVEVRDHFAAASGVSTASATLRVTAARIGAALHLQTNDSAGALLLVERAVELIPQIATRDLERDDREHRIVGMSGLPAVAAAAAIGAGNPRRAVELLEQTRGLLLAGSLDTRSDLTDLRDQHAGLAAEFDELRQAIDHVDHPDSPHAPPLDQPIAPGLTGTPDYRQSAEQRARLNQRWTGLLDHIRSLEGSAGFLRPPPIDELRKQAAHGPVVYITVHGPHGHALLVVDHADRPVRVVSLPDLTQGAAARHIELLRAAQETASNPENSISDLRAAQRQTLEVFGWLWNAIAEPVLRYLGHITTPAEQDRWPRIWWCPVGIITFLPLHAAGHHTAAPEADSPNTVMDRVISSYTATIRALAFARTTTYQPHVASGTPSVVIVAVPDAPGSPLLRGVVRETERLRQLVPTATTLPAPGTTTTRATVLAALATHPVAHFACHGLADWTTPANSRLLLHDHLDRPLTVALIARLRLTDGELAYLSACSTTDTHPRHADEATHLTAAFHLAGYRAVIGTLWPISDHAAIAITDGIYSRLTHNGTMAPDPTIAAHALHQAIRQHRARRPAVPTQWAAYIHTGR